MASKVKRLYLEFWWSGFTCGLSKGYFFRTVLCPFSSLFLTIWHEFRQTYQLIPVFLFSVFPLLGALEFDVLTLAQYKAKIYQVVLSEFWCSQISQMLKYFWCCDEHLISTLNKIILTKWFSVLWLIGEWSRDRISGDRNWHFSGDRKFFKIDHEIEIGIFILFEKLIRRSKRP